MKILVLLYLVYTAFGHPIGVEVDSRPSAFIDAAKLARFSPASSACKYDADGWMLCDGQIVIFDDRAFGTWGPPPYDDPLLIEVDDSGEWTFEFKGKATVTSPFPDNKIGNIKFDNATWTTTGTIVLSKDSHVMVLQFANSQRDSKSATGSGITGLRVIRPGYKLGDDLTKIFTDDLKTALEPFDHFRTMGWRDTNYFVWSYGTPPGGMFGWADRSLPSDATQGSSHIRAGSQGIAWEYILFLANIVNKDVWINVPVQATGTSVSDKTSYVYQLALLFRDGNAFTGHKGLNSNLNIYIEHSNEVWNYGFTQYAWNKAEAVKEVNTTNKVLNEYFVPDGAAPEVWARRRHLQQVYQIGQIFVDVFGKSSQNTRIRPIYAHWSIFPNQYNETLTWFEKVYGAPSSFIYGIAQTHYYDEGKAGPSATVDQVVAALNASSNEGRTITVQLSALSKFWKLHHTSYESGSGFAEQNTVNIANRITANRDPRMREIVKHDIIDNWIALGGEQYNYFTLAGAYSRYGCWGLTDDIRNLTTPKYLGVLDAIKQLQNV